MRIFKTTLTEINKNSNPTNRTFLLKNVIELDNGKKIVLAQELRESELKEINQ